ncbi:MULTISPECIES: TolB family protein [Bacillus]|uniref:TolB family protein n=1 Tax=Bacillus TaxID=1386 RepID=UPI0002D9F2FF|nr:MULTISPECIES: PD40 domain-containing protein [Bacillus]AIK39429.1 eukaryotic translation initiation factor eIF2A family protein [Bacillus pseudomycoides]AJI18891.1 eukaryotic translation initiation factor eIF2A family protein [Bacillus pseudomycoides]MED1595275.1 PD40 domain-containing protein [Bacillus pseudomycoides]MED4709417.1 PD40 domain-containing protein [Bacillus pseudomycoides]OOR53712.1 translocation protein TolB [Bacillus pseudomycoides]
MWRKIIVLIVCVCCLCEAVPTVQAETKNIQVAFIRNHNLWIKIDGNEKQITKGEYITKPKWSHDGKWIAYAKGEEQNQLELYRVADGKKVVPSQTEATNYQWSPAENIIAFEFTSTLNTFDAEKKNATFENVSSGVGDYAWYPDGKKFLVSSEAQLLPTGWTGAQLYEVQKDAGMNPNKMKHLYTLPSMQEDFLAYIASDFKWSPNQKWIAFLAVPTASWSADSNTLCLLKADGSYFEKVDQMLLNSQWIQWSPSKNILAYIEGSGRFALENKHLKIKELPALQQEKFTPKGYVDWDFTWQDNELITLSRAKEMEWSNEEEKRSLPSLYQVNIQSNRQRQITTPSKKYGDYNPLYIKSENQLTWMRSDRKKADMWLANGEGSKAKKWIENIDVPQWYYEKWNWEEVISVKEG